MTFKLFKSLNTAFLAATVAVCEGRAEDAQRLFACAETRRRCGWEE